jgi:hypothetical protein
MNVDAGVRPRVLQHQEIEYLALDADALGVASADIGKIALDAGSAAHHKTDAPQRMPLSGRELRQHAHPVEEADARRHHALAARFVSRKTRPFQKDDVVAGFR